jgi:hypothetical protein
MDLASWCRGGDVSLFSRWCTRARASTRLKVELHIVRSSRRFQRLNLIPAKAEALCRAEAECSLDEGHGRALTALFPRSLTRGTPFFTGFIFAVQRAERYMLQAR